MTYNDWIGTIGVGLVLLAYFLNTMKWVPENGKFFFILNVIGGALSCYAAVLIDFMPFRCTWKPSGRSFQFGD